MSDALSGMLPLAAAIAVSPIPILAVILMLLSERATQNALAFLAGWAIALALIAGVVAILGSGSADAGEEPAPGLIAAQFVLASILLAAAIRRWRKRPGPGEVAEVPKWMGRLRTIGPPGALGLGLGLIALNPKDALLSVAAGARLAEADPGAGAGVPALALFVLVASSTIVAPIAATVASGARARPLLGRWRGALEQHGQVAVAAVLLVLAVLVALDAALAL
ncbi:MAG: GAP family protein [Solirubrobacterales bacterium]